VNGIVCIACKAFNGPHGSPGEEKPRTKCRVCDTELPKDMTGTGRADLLEIIEALKKELATVYENLSTTQARCTALLEEKRRLEWQLSRLPSA
jgi:hypothetical protein